MRRPAAVIAVVFLAMLAACSSGQEGVEHGSPEGGTDGAAVVDAAPEHAGDAAGHDATTPLPVDGGGDASPAVEAGDGGDGGSDCEVFGAPGQCITTSACAATPDHTSYAGHCPGPADIECCIDTPDVADDPPVPAGWALMQQSQVTSAMTAWAVAILDDPVTYPMFSTTTQTFGVELVMARVEWHPPDFQNNVVHRGVTLYVPTD
jgi:hypothetical protein